MKHPLFSPALVAIAGRLAALFCGAMLLAPCWTNSLGEPVVAPTPKTASKAPVAPAAAPSGLRVIRKVPSPSGQLEIEYLRDAQKGIREIALQDAHDPTNTAVLTQYKRNAWVVMSPDEEWVIINNREGSENGAQLYHRTGTAPLRYEVPAELRGAGASLQDLVWQTYLKDTQQDSNTDRSQVTIDGLTWEPDSHRVTVSVAPIATKNDTALPEPWMCTYDVTTRQIEPPAEAAVNPPDSEPNDETASATDESEAQPNDEASTANETAEFEGEKFPATREESITMADANELDLADLRYAINEMLARHGPNFRDPKIKKTFAEFSWYAPRTDVSPDAVENEFSELEKSNMAVLRRCRDAKIAATRQHERKPIRGEPVDETDGQRALQDVLQGVSDALNGGH